VGRVERANDLANGVFCKPTIRAQSGWHRPPFGVRNASLRNGLRHTPYEFRELSGLAESRGTEGAGDEGAEGFQGELTGSLSEIDECGQCRRELPQCESSRVGVEAPFGA
jgi:hypothetical protein